MDKNKSLSTQGGNSKSHRERTSDSSADVEVVNSWWDSAIRNRMTAAYQCGRYLSLLDWDFKHSLFFSMRGRQRVIDEILGRLAGMSYELDPAQHSRHREIEACRRGWRGWIECEAAADEVAACYDDRWSTSSDNRHELITIRIRRPLLDPIESGFASTLADDEMRTLELGRCVDQCVRRPDVADFFEQGLTRPGELEPGPAWRHILQALVKRVGLDDVDLGAWTMEEVPSNRYSRLRRVAELDSAIRRHFAGIAPDRESSISEEYLSRPMTKKEIARFYGGERVRNPTVYLNTLVKQRHLTKPIGHGQNWQVDVREFPENVRDRMRLPIASKN